MGFRLGSGVRRRICGLAALAFAVSAAGGQTPGAPRNDVRLGAQSREVTPSRADSPRDTWREIRDVHTGTRWLILRNLHNPAGPGLMMTADGSHGLNPDFAAQRNAASFVIHSGDWLLVEEHTAAVDSYLEAVALEGAELGGTFDVRLKLGGRVVKVTATARGKAAFARREKGQR